MERSLAVSSRAPLLLMGVVLSLAACRDIPGPPPPPASLVIVSDPVANGPPPGLGSNSSPEASAGVGVTYVSLPAGTIPQGKLATIQNLGTQSTVTVPLSAGGFDPVAVVAAIGDTIVIVVRDALDAVELETRIAVAASRRPIVVRTDPPPRKRDVPLNAIIIIVFSEPIDANTLTETSVRLLRGSTPVSGRVELRDAEGLTAAFLPDAPLVAGTEYQLDVAQGIRDRDGEALEAAVTATFTTGSTVLQAASVTVLPETLLAARAPVEAWVVAIVRDANGTELFNVPVQWSSSNPRVIDLPRDGTWDEAGRNVQLINYAGGAGSVTFTATVSGARPGAGTFVFDSVRMSAVSAGDNGGTCALTASGQAFCQGGNQNGQLGIGVAGMSSGELVEVAGDLLFTTISAGHSHNCAITFTGAAYCWGWNSYNQVGVPPSYAETMPVPVSGGLTFRSISTGLAHSCGLVVNGDAYCWGGGWPGWNNGVLGNGSTTGSSTPVAVVGGLTFAEISAGGGHTCGLTSSGAAYCWGWNLYGQLGDSAYANSASPVAVAGGLSFNHISAGDRHTCAVTAEGAAYCWGDQGAGWGVGAPTASFSPELVPLPAGLTLAQIDAGDPQTCGLTADGAAYCWGFHPGSNGPDIWQPPTGVAGVMRFSSVSSGFMKWCGVTLEPDVYCEYWSWAP